MTRRRTVTATVGLFLLVRLSQAQHTTEFVYTPTAAVGTPQTGFYSRHRLWKYGWEVDDPWSNCCEKTYKGKTCPGTGRNAPLVTPGGGGLKCCDTWSCNIQAPGSEDTLEDLLVALVDLYEGGRTGPNNGYGRFGFTEAGGIEELIAQAASRGHQVVIRISAAWSFLNANGTDKNHRTIPAFIDQEPGMAYCKHSDLQNGHSRVFIPVWDSEPLLRSFEEVITALGAKYDGDKRIFAWHVGMLGMDGTWWQGDDQWRDPNLPQCPFASEQTQARVLRAWHKAFPRSLLMAPDPTRTGGLDLAREVPNLGFFDFNFGSNAADLSLQNYSANVKSALGDRWRTAAVGARMPDVLGACWLAADPDAACARLGQSTGLPPYADALRMLRAGAVQTTAWRRVGDTDAGGMERIKEAAAGSGPRFALRRVSAELQGGKLTVCAEVENTGSAPFLAQPGLPGLSLAARTHTDAPFTLGELSGAAGAAPGDGVRTYIASTDFSEVFDECAAGRDGAKACPTGQTCEDTNTSPLSRGDWECVCGSVRERGRAAVCTAPTWTHAGQWFDRRAADVIDAGNSKTLGIVDSSWTMAARLYLPLLNSNSNARPADPTAPFLKRGEFATVFGSDTDTGGNGQGATSFALGFGWPEWFSQMSWPSLATVRFTVAHSGSDPAASAGVKLVENGNFRWDVESLTPGGTIDKVIQAIDGGPYDLRGWKLNKILPSGGGAEIVFGDPAQGKNDLNGGLAKVPAGDSVWEFFDHGKPTKWSGDKWSDALKNADRRWHHVAWRYSKDAQEFSFWLDGVMRVGSGGWKPFQADASISIGRQKGKADGLFFGHLSELRIYGGAALPKDDMLRLAALPVPLESKLPVQLTLQSPFAHRAVLWATNDSRQALPQTCCGCTSCLRYAMLHPAECEGSGQYYNPVPYDRTCGLSETCGACGTVSVGLPPVGRAPDGDRGCLDYVPGSAPTPQPTPPATPAPTAATAGCAELTLAGFNWTSMGASGPIAADCDGKYEAVGQGHWRRATPDAERELWAAPGDTYRCTVAGGSADGALLGGPGAEQAGPGWWAARLKCEAYSTPMPTPAPTPLPPGVTAAPDTPAPATPAPESPAPGTPAPATPAPATPVPPTGGPTAPPSLSPSQRGATSNPSVSPVLPPTGGPSASPVDPPPPGAPSASPRVPVTGAPAAPSAAPSAGPVPPPGAPTRAPVAPPTGAPGSGSRAPSPAANASAPGGSPPPAAPPGGGGGAPTAGPSTAGALSGAADGQQDKGASEEQIPWWFWVLLALAVVCLVTCAVSWRRFWTRRQLGDRVRNRKTADAVTFGGLPPPSDGRAAAGDVSNVKLATYSQLGAEPRRAGSTVSHMSQSQSGKHSPPSPPARQATSPPARQPTAPPAPDSDGMFAI